jgi:hypothetical protein
MTRRIPRLSLAAAIAVVAGASMAATASSAATVHKAPGPWFKPGNLVVSRSVYTGTSSLLTPGVTQLPPGCVSGCVAANNDGSYPGVFNNVLVDPSFGVASPIFLDQITPSGALVNTLAVPNGSKGGDHVVTSFSSKSEIALNLSTSGKQLSFMGYLARPNDIDVSNSNTPAVFDPTNLVPGSNYRVIAEVDKNGKLRYTVTNAYSGNNGRAAIVNDSHGHRVIYLTGNAGNGGNPQPDGVISGAGAQFALASRKAESAQAPGAPQPLGSFSITQLGDPIDKVGKDTNFRGLTMFNNVLYYTKGSGSNGVNTVYFLDTTGKACPNGVGVPEAGAKLPTKPINFDPSQLQTQGVTPFNMCILKGFPTALKSKTAFPFGLWFANATTLYVADEGNGDATFSASSGTFTKAAAQTTAGLQKWVFNGISWNLAYTISAGLKLGVPYTVAGYPTGNNAATGLPWSPATDGLRNITGRVNGDGTVTVWGITSTVSGDGDQGADPNELVAVSDTLSATSAAGSAGDSFSVIRGAGVGEVLRGVSFTPGS